MNTTLVIQLIFLVCLLLLSAFFSASETAFTTANRIRMRTLAEEGNPRAKKVLKLWEKQSKLLSSILIGNNIVNLSASSLATVIAVKLLGSYGAGIATFVLTFLILIVGEITPKNIATLRAEEISLKFAGVIFILMKILTPIIFIVTFLSHGLIRLLGVDPLASKPTMTEGELKTIVDVSHESGVIESDEREMIYNVFHFGDSIAKEIMIPRIDMVMIESSGSYDELMALFSEEKLTRYPVYEGSNDNIIGFINMKDILLIDSPDDFDIRKLMRKPYYTHEHKSTSELLVEMRNEHVNIAIVLDEYGSAAGMITMEDLLEEIVGEIRDEYDDDEVDVIRKLSDTEYEVDGKANLDDIDDRLNLNLNSEDYDTIGGFVLGLSDQFPTNGQVFYPENNLMIRVENIENNRIDKLYIQILPKDQDAEGSSE